MAKLALPISLLCLCAAGCDSENGPSPDGAAAVPDASTQEPATTPRPVIPPAVPHDPASPTEVSLAPCPEGWDARQIPQGASSFATVCEPFPSGEPDTCPDGTRPEPGAPACLPVGAACPANDPFGPAAPQDALFVMPEASAGDGTRASPFGSIAEATAAAPDGGVVALAVGRYEEHVRLDRDVRLRGACATGTIISPTGGSTAALTVEADVQVEALTVQAPAAGIVVSDGATLELARVEVRAAEMALDVAGTVTASEAMIRGAPVRVTADGMLVGTQAAIVESPSVGIDVSGGSLELTRSMVWNASDVGIRATSDGVARLTETVVWGATGRGLQATGEGAELSLSNVVVRSVRDRDDGPPGAYAASIGVGGGADLEAEGLFIDQPALIGLAVEDEASTATLRDLVVQGTGVPADGGACLWVVNGAWLDASRVALERCSDFGAVFSHASGQLIDAWVSEPLARSTGVGGLGLLSGSSSVVVRRAVVQRAHHVGAAVSDSTGQLALIDVVVRETRPEVASGEWGTGAVAINGGKLILERVRLDENTGTGLLARDGGASITGSDVRVRRMRPVPAGANLGIGIGLSVFDDSRVDLARVAVEESVGLGVLVRGRARLADLTVMETLHWERPPHLGSLWGRGLEVQYGTLDLVRAQVERNHADGIVVVGQGALLEGRDVTVVNTLDNGADREGCGVLIFQTAAANVEGLRVAGNRYIGVSAHGLDSRLELTDLEVLDTQEAACAPDCFAGGIGLGAYASAGVRAERFRIVGSALAGVQVARGGQLDLVHGEVRGSPIGANVQDPGYELNRISSTVRYVDNERNLDAMSLPVPEPGGTVGITAEPGF